MTRYVKSKKASSESEFDEKKIVAAMKRRRIGRKVPTSVALDPELIAEVKEEAESRGIPYQVLLRMFIIEGFKNLKRVS